MPAKSKRQQMAAGAALAAKRGKKSKGSLKGPAKRMEKSMSQKQLRDVAKTKRKKLPAKKTKAASTKKSASAKKTGGAKKTGATRKPASRKKK